MNKEIRTILELEIEEYKKQAERSLHKIKRLTEELSKDVEKETFTISFDLQNEVSLYNITVTKIKEFKKILSLKEL